MALFGKKQTLDLSVSGMTCGHCVATVTEALKGVPGVASAKVDLDAGKAQVTVKDPVDPALLVAAVKEAGYQASA